MFAGWLAMRSFQTVELSPGAFLRFDDFDFTVVSAREIPLGAVRSRYAVQLAVKNPARTLNFDFQPDCVEVSANGEYLMPATVGRPQTLGAGQSLTRVAEYIGPRGLGSLMIGFRLGGFISQILDKALYGNRVIIVKTAKAGEPALNSDKAALQ